MIKVNNLSKSFGKQKVLKDVNIEFPDKGLYFILGPSGCGKSTFLNCLTGLLDFSGDIFIDGENINNFNDERMSNYRLRNIGFVFQDFKLFMHDNVFENIILPLRCISGLDNNHQRQKVEDVVELIGIKNLIYKKVNELSGGEKQRVAIARSIINEPKILLCDEPTGSLDSINKIEIMSILKTLSTTRLVIVVSHDEDLAKKYADGFCILKDGKITTNNIKKIQDDKRYLAMFHDATNLKKCRLPLKFLLKHTKNCMRERKFRSIITNLVVSFGLLGTGLAFMISDIVYQSVVSSYTNIISDNQIMVTNKHTSTSIKNLIAVEQPEILNILNNYKKDIYGNGTCYVTDFESYFRDSNNLYLLSGIDKYALPGYSARSINDFEWLDLCNKQIFPRDIQELRDDEVIISLTPIMLREICYQLRISQSVESLSEYLLQNDVFLCFDFANNYWQYHDEQILNFKAFILDRNPVIYHSNHLWNEIMFQDNMRIPINYNFTELDDKPWIMKKVHYIYTLLNNEFFIDKTMDEDELNDYVFEIANKQFFPLLLKDKPSKDIHRLLVFENTFPKLRTSDWKYMKKLQNSVKNPIFTTYSGYSVYGTSLLSGFNNVMFFSGNEQLLDETTGIFASKGYDPTQSINLPPGVLQGHYTKTSNNGVFFKGLQDEIIIGNSPKSLNEIVISQGMAKNLFFDENPIGKVINLSLTSSSFSSDKNKYNLKFQNDKIIIVGLTKNDKNILYHNEYWSITYFQCRLGISIFELLPVGLSMEIGDNDDSQTIIKNLSKEFPNYSFVNPMKDIETQTDTLCHYMKIILFTLSLTTLLIAICLISICNYLHVIEVRKDIGLIRCLGINKMESSKILYFHSLFVAIAGALSSIVEMSLLYFALQLGLNKILFSEMVLSINILPYISVLLISILIGVIPAFIVSFKLKKINPLSAMK